MFLDETTQSEAIADENMNYGTCDERASRQIKSMYAQFQTV